MKAFKPFDYFVIAIGVIGTLNALGVATMPEPLVVVLGIASTFFCLSSVILLLFHAYVPRLELTKYRRHVLYTFSNLVPAIYVLMHLKETPWEHFAG